MITIITDKGKKVKFDGTLEFPSYVKRNFKEEETIYGKPIQNYTSKGIAFKINATEIDEVTVDKIIKIFYEEDTIMVKNNENNKLYHGIKFSDKELKPVEKFNYDTNDFTYTLSMSMKSGK